MPQRGTYKNGFAPRDGCPLYPSLWKGCVGAWAPCLGPSGIHLLDWSGLRRDGTLTGMDPGTDWVTAGDTYVLEFDGTDDYVQLGPLSGAGASATTVAGWIYFNNFGTFRFLLDGSTSGPTGNGISLYVEIGTGNVVFWNYSASFLARSTQALQANTWYHICATWDGTTSKLFINAKQDGESVGDSSTAGGGSFRIGSSATYLTFWLGMLDDVRLYDRALSPQEIALLASRRGIAYELDRSVAVIEVAAEDLIVGDTSMAWSVNYRENGSDVVKHVFAWVSDSGGIATVPSSIPVSGRIERVVIVPSASAAPTSLYDVTLTDSNSIDVLAGQGANLSATVSSSVCPGTPLKDGTTVSVTPTAVDSILTLNVTNAGNTKSGTVVVYVR